MRLSPGMVFSLLMVIRRLLPCIFVTFLCATLCTGASVNEDEVYTTEVFRARASGILQTLAFPPRIIDNLAHLDSYWIRFLHRHFDRSERLVAEIAADLPFWGPYLRPALEGRNDAAESLDEVLKRTFLDFVVPKLGCMPYYYEYIRRAQKSTMIFPHFVHELCKMDRRDWSSINTALAKAIRLHSSNLKFPRDYSYSVFYAGLLGFQMGEQVEDSLVLIGMTLEEYVADKMQSPVYATQWTQSLRRLTEILGITVAANPKDFPGVSVMVLNSWIDDMILPANRSSKAVFAELLQDPKVRPLMGPLWSPSAILDAYLLRLIFHRDGLDKYLPTLYDLNPSLAITVYADYYPEYRRGDFRHEPQDGALSACFFLKDSNIRNAFLALMKRCFDLEDSIDIAPSIETFSQLEIYLANYRNVMESIDLAQEFGGDANWGNLEFEMAPRLHDRPALAGNLLPRRLIDEAPETRGQFREGVESCTIEWSDEEDPVTLNRRRQETANFRSAFRQLSSHSSDDDGEVRSTLFQGIPVPSRSAQDESTQLPNVLENQLSGDRIRAQMAQEDGNASDYSDGSSDSEDFSECSSLSSDAEYQAGSRRKVIYYAFIGMLIMSAVAILVYICC